MNAFTNNKSEKNQTSSITNNMLPTCKIEENIYHDTNLSSIVSFPIFSLDFKIHCFCSMVYNQFSALLDK